MGTHIFLVHIFLEDYSPFVGIIGIPVAPVDPEVQQSHVADGIQAGRIQEVLQLDEFLFCQFSIGMIQDVLHLGPDILEIFRLGKFSQSVLIVVISPLSLRGVWERICSLSSPSFCPDLRVK